MGREIESGIEYHFSMREKMAKKGRQDFMTQRQSHFPEKSREKQQRNKNERMTIAAQVQKDADIK